MKRQIEPKMIAWLDKKLSSDPIAFHALVNKDPRLLLQQAARACVGIREASGNNDGVMVELIQETVGSADNEPWCMALVQTLIAYVEVKLDIKSPLIVTEHVMTCWNTTPFSQRVKRIPLPGAIVCWRHGSTSSGHTGIVIDCDGKNMHVIEGNTSSGVSPDGKVEREGQGCYLTHRSAKATGSMVVQGFLRPF